MGGLFCFNFLNDKVNSEQSTPIGYNVPQPYADAKGWRVCKGICVKGAVIKVR